MVWEACEVEFLSHADPPPATFQRWFDEAMIPARAIPMSTPQPLKQPNRLAASGRHAQADWPSRRS